MNLFKRRHTFIIFLKSGQQFWVRATNCTVKHNTETGEVTSWEFKNLKKAWPVYIQPNQIEAVVQVL